MKEQLIQTKITNFCKSKGCKVLNVTKSNLNWIADLQIFTWNWKHFWCEVKKPDWVESKLQQFRRKEFTKIWDIWIVAYWYEDFIKKTNHLWNS